tara:strand:- start:2733 stop:3104 length:372 start_codon:yes stop_codon:yes gene_type:complete
MDKESKGFDLSKYQIANQTRSVPIVIEETGDEFEITIKQLSWSKRNQLVSSCLSFSNSGETSFNGDKYVRECLKDMIIEAPWGKTTEAFLVTIDERLGAALEELVPKAFSTPDVLDADTVKKE